MNYRIRISRRSRAFRPAGRRAQQRGFNLIELMVALLVTSLGMAGVAALLLGGMSASHSANLNSIAVAHAQTAVEMMRANLNAYTQAWYAGGNTSGDSYSLTVCGGASGCSQVQQANNDWAVWRQRLAAELPDGRGYICMDSDPDDGQPGALACDGAGFNVIKIFWRDSRDEESLQAGEDFHRFVTTVNP